MDLLSTDTKTLLYQFFLAGNYCLKLLETTLGMSLCCHTAAILQHVKQIL